MNALYLIGLLVGIAGMVVLDLRLGLFFRRAPLRAVIVLVVGVAFFLVWDLAGIGLGVFFPGRSAIVTGVLLAPGLPLEEPFFLVLLAYSAMNAYALAPLGAKAISGLRRGVGVDGRPGRRET